MTQRKVIQDQAIAPQLASELEAIAEAAGCELVHIEWKGGTLRLFIDRPDESGGVNLSDCELVSKQASALLDVADFGSGRYVLEVSSPGLDRGLYRPRDWERFVGRLARVTFKTPDTGAKRTIVARLAGFDAASGDATLLDEGSNERHIVNLKNVIRARLEVEL